MEFQIGPIWKTVQVDKSGFHIFDSKNTGQYNKNNNSLNGSFNRNHFGNDILGRFSSNNNFNQKANHFATIIDTMGALSAKAQGLKSIITTYDKIISNDVRLYMKIDDTRVQGFIKVGSKKLFYRDQTGGIKELNCLCVLDFYCHESVQRQGIGKLLFQKMLENESAIPERIAYDRPSEKFISFLRKHYGLVNYVPQNSNFVIFDNYFLQGQIKIDDRPPKYQVPNSDSKLNYHMKSKYGNQQDENNSRNLLNSRDQPVTPTKEINSATKRPPRPSLQQQQQQQVQGIRKERGTRSLSKKKVSFKEINDYADDEEFYQKVSENVERTSIERDPNSLQSRIQNSLYGIDNRGNTMYGNSTNFLGLQPNSTAFGQTISAPRDDIEDLEEQEELEKQQQLEKEKEKEKETLNNNIRKSSPLQSKQKASQKPSSQTLAQQQASFKVKNKIPNYHHRQNNQNNNSTNISAKKPPLLPNLIPKQQPNPIITTHDQNNGVVRPGRRNSFSGKDNNIQQTKSQKVLKTKNNFNNTYDNPRLLQSNMTTEKKQLPPTQKKTDILDNIKKNEVGLKQVNDQLDQFTRGRNLDNQQQRGANNNIIGQPYQSGSLGPYRGGNNSSGINQLLNHMQGSTGKNDQYQTSSNARNGYSYSASKDNKFNNQPSPIRKAGAQSSTPWAQFGADLSRQPNNFQTSSQSYGRNFRRF